MYAIGSDGQVQGLPQETTKDDIDTVYAWDAQTQKYVEYDPTTSSDDQSNQDFMKLAAQDKNSLKSDSLYQQEQMTNPNSPTAPFDFKFKPGTAVFLNIKGVGYGMYAIGGDGQIQGFPQGTTKDDIDEVCAFDAQTQKFVTYDPTTSSNDKSNQDFMQLERAQS